MSQKNDTVRSGDNRQRIQKVLANAGFASRRTIEDWIRSERIQINDRLAQIGDKISTQDHIRLDGRKINNKDLWRESKDYIILYNKPEGQVVSRKDNKGRDSVFHHLPRLQHKRWIAAGRLDINSSGLLLFTTSGEMANRLMRPAQRIEREYAVRIYGEVRKDGLMTLVQGIEIDDRLARFEDIVESGGEAKNRWYHVVIMEGRNRIVRRLWQSIGVEVNRLKRVRFGEIFLNSAVKSGQWRSLTKEEFIAIEKMTGLSNNAFTEFKSRQS